MKQLVSVTVEQMEEIERLTIYQYGLQVGQMIENAGRALARLSRILLDGRVLDKKIVVMAGAGKNAGGGLAAARTLHNWGADVAVSLAVHEGALKRSALAQLNILRSMDVAIDDAGVLSKARLEKADLIIDAVLGYSAKGAPSSEFASAIQAINKAGRPILSLDVPSGMDATTGEAHAPCVRASATLALTVPKMGVLTDAAVDYVGQLWLADTGIPLEILGDIGLAGDNPFIDDDLVLLRHQASAMGITA